MTKMNYRKTLLKLLKPTEAVTNEMCDVDEGDIRNKGNKKRQNCY